MFVIGGCLATLRPLVASVLRLKFDRVSTWRTSRRPRTLSANTAMTTASTIVVEDGVGPLNPTPKLPPYDGS
jgi:hypothetical protein